MNYAVRPVKEIRRQLVLPLPDKIVIRYGILRGQEFKVGAYREDGQVVIIAKSLPSPGDRHV